MEPDSLERLTEEIRQMEADEKQEGGEVEPSGFEIAKKEEERLLELFENF